MVFVNEPGLELYREVVAKLYGNPALPQKSDLLKGRKFWFVCNSCDFVDRLIFLDKGTIHEVTRTKHELVITEIYF